MEYNVNTDVLTSMCVQLYIGIHINALSLTVDFLYVIRKKWRSAVEEITRNRIQKPNNIVFMYIIQSTHNFSSF